MSLWSGLSPSVKWVVIGGSLAILVLLAMWGYGESDAPGTEMPRGVNIQSR